MTLAELAEASDLPARTIRFYIARGLLNGPVKSGREAEYTGAHLERIDRIKKLQAQGRTLAEIGYLLNEPAQKSAAPEPQAWWQYAIGDDVMVWVKAGTNPWFTRQVRTLAAEFARAVAQLQKERSGKPERE
jgi:DNA-binding transcriptional MerR regulator